MAQTGKAPQEGAQDAPALPHGDNRPQPVRSLREWLDHLAARERLLVVKPGTGLRFELAAIAKRLDGLRATLFPRPGGHPIPVVSGLVSDRGWMAEAMGVEPGEVLARFQDAALHPVPWRETQAAPAQEVVHRHVDLARLLPLPTHNEYDSGPYVSAGLMITRNPRTGKQNVSIHRCQLSGPNRLGVLLLPRHAHMFFEHGGAGRESRSKPPSWSGSTRSPCSPRKRSRRSMSTSWRSPAHCTGGRCRWSSASPAICGCRRRRRS